MRRTWIAAGVLLVLFVADLVLVAAQVHGLTAFDRRSDVAATDALARHPTWTRFWLDVSDVLSPTVWRAVGGAAAVVLLARRRLRAGLTIAAVLIGAAVISGGVKVAVDRPRPTPPHALAHALGASFPSGHALTASAAVLVLLAVAGRAGLPAGRALRVGLCVLGTIAVFAVSLSRVLIGVHYPSDVVGGLLAGTGWTLVVLAVAERWERGPAPRRPHLLVS